VCSCPPTSPILWPGLSLALTKGEGKGKGVRWRRGVMDCWLLHNDGPEESTGPAGKTWRQLASCQGNQRREGNALGSKGLREQFQEQRWMEGADQRARSIAKALSPHPAKAGRSPCQRNSRGCSGQSEGWNWQGKGQLGAISVSGTGRVFSAFG